jgi:hypothetical protein
VFHVIGIPRVVLYSGFEPEPQTCGRGSAERQPFDAASLRSESDQVPDDIPGRVRARPDF